MQRTVPSWALCRGECIHVRRFHASCVHRLRSWPLRTNRRDQVRSMCNRALPSPAGNAIVQPMRSRAVHDRCWEHRMRWLSAWSVLGPARSIAVCTVYCRHVSAGNRSGIVSKLQSVPRGPVSDWMRLKHCRAVPSVCGGHVQGWHVRKDDGLQGVCCRQVLNTK